MGCILKNRAGSLEKTKLEELFEEAMNIYLRILPGGGTHLTYQFEWPLREEFCLSPYKRTRSFIT